MTGPVPPGNRPESEALKDQLRPETLEGPMQPEVTPTEARSGVVTGRVITVLVVSFIGAAGGMALAWYFLTQ